MANTIFGAQEATKGEKSLLAARVPNILSKKINTIPMAIPMARLTPIPPRRFTEETATAMIVNMYAETGKLHLLWTHHFV